MTDPTQFVTSTNFVRTGRSLTTSARTTALIFEETMIRRNDKEFAALADSLETPATDWNDWQDLGEQKELFREGGRKITTPWEEQFLQQRALQAGEIPFVFVDFQFAGTIDVVAGDSFSVLINDEFAHPAKAGDHLTFIKPKKVQVTFPDGGGTLLFATDDKA